MAPEDDCEGTASRSRENVLRLFSEPGWDPYLKCFCVHRYLENTIKARMVRMGLTPARTRRLDELIGTLPDIGAKDEMLRLSGVISRYGISAGYPGIDERPLTDEDADAALGIADEMVRLLESYDRTGFTDTCGTFDLSDPPIDLSGKHSGRVYFGDRGHGSDDHPRWTPCPASAACPAGARIGPRALPPLPHP